MATKKKATKKVVIDEELRIVGDVVIRDIGLFKPNDWNPNELTAFEKESLRHGLKSDGWLKSQSMLVRGKDERGNVCNEIIDGEHRWIEAKALGFKKCPVVILDGLTREQAIKLTIKLDAKRGKFNDKKLGIAAKQVVGDDTDFGVLGIDLGIEPDTLEELLVDDAPKQLAVDDDKGEDEPPIPDAPTEPKTKWGDLIFLGRHRLLCGDSLDTDMLARLIDGATIDCVLTDPPYAIYGSSTGLGADIADDAMIIPFFDAMFRSMLTCLREQAHVYACCDWRSYAVLWQCAKKVKLAPKNCIVWDKMSPGLGSSYSMAHEFIGFWSRMPPAKAMRTSTLGGQRKILRPNILRYTRPQGEERKINAAKPVAMFAELIGNSTDEGQKVLDMFAGSGTTILAAEKTNRVAYAVEKNPAACDIIVERWEKLTGLKSTRRSAA